MFVTSLALFYYKFKYYQYLKLSLVRYLEKLVSSEDKAISTTPREIYKIIELVVQCLIKPLSKRTIEITVS